MSALSRWTSPQLRDSSPGQAGSSPNSPRSLLRKATRHPLRKRGDRTADTPRAPGAPRALPGRGLRVPRRGRSNELGPLAPSSGPAALEGDPGRGPGEQEGTSGRKLTGSGCSGGVPGAGRVSGPDLRRTPRSPRRARSQAGPASRAAGRRAWLRGSSDVQGPGPSEAPLVSQGCHPPLCCPRWGLGLKPVGQTASCCHPLTGMEPSLVLLLM